MSYQEPNALYDPACVSEGEMLCEPEFLAITSQGGNDIFTQANALAGGGVQMIGLGASGQANGDGHFTGQQTVTLIVPTGRDVRLEYTAYNMSRCFDVAACALDTDASHSDYLGLNLAPGVSFASTQAFQYLGVPSPVPEPTTAVLSLIGVAALAFRVRQQSARRAGA